MVKQGILFQEVDRKGKKKFPISNNPLFYLYSPHITIKEDTRKQLICFKSIGGLRSV